MTTAIQIYNPKYAKVMFIFDKAVSIVKALEYINICTNRLKRVDDFKCSKKKKKQQFRLSALLSMLISMSWSEIFIITTQQFNPNPSFAKGGIIA